MDWALAAAGLGVGVIVGLTGMGGGALMTPVLVIFFGIPPLAAVSSDLVASAIMKPFGSLVHIRARRVDWRLVGWLCAGSVPCAFAGVLAARAVGGAHLDHVIRIALGCALMLAVAGLVARACLPTQADASVGGPAEDGPAEGPAANRPATGVASDAVSAASGPDASGPDASGPDASQTRAAAGARDDRPIRRVRVKPMPTLLLGAAGGLVVGMTSVGSGSLIIVALLALYPALRPGDLVGTDLAQATPLVAAAALGQFLFGDFRFDVTFPLLLGAVPGVLIGARISARGRGGLIRGALAVVLFASSLKLLGAGNAVLVAGVAVAIVVAALAGPARRQWTAVRARRGHAAARRDAALNRGI